MSQPKCVSSKDKILNNPNYFLKSIIMPSRSAIVAYSTNETDYRNYSQQPIENFGNTDKISSEMEINNFTDKSIGNKIVTYNNIVDNSYLSSDIIDTLKDGQFALFSGENYLGEYVIHGQNTQIEIINFLQKNIIKSTYTKTANLGIWFFTNNKMIRNSYI